jgi:CO/xanthine dehydrogenase Mo-binding subunit
MGRGITPMFLEGRVYGRATMGMGYALTEVLIAAPAIATAIYDVIGVRG